MERLWFEQWVVIYKNKKNTTDIYAYINIFFLRFKTNIINCMFIVLHGKAKKLFLNKHN